MPSIVPDWVTNAIVNAGTYYYDRITGKPVTPPPTLTPPVSPADSGTSLFIPGSSVSDILLNAVTGKPTDAQIAVNTNACVAAIQHMRQVNPGSVPAGAENQCATDQQAYVKLIGGTANTQAPITAWAWVILLGVVGTVYVVTR